MLLGGKIDNILSEALENATGRHCKCTFSAIFNDHLLLNAGILWTPLSYAIITDWCTFILRAQPNDTLNQITSKQEAVVTYWLPTKKLL